MYGVSYLRLAKKIGIFAFHYSQPSLNHQHDCLYSTTDATPHIAELEKKRKAKKIKEKKRKEKRKEKIKPSSLLSLLRNSGNVNSYRMMTKIWK
jgi:hypothetical protein